MYFVGYPTASVMAPARVKACTLVAAIWSNPASLSPGSGRSRVRSTSARETIPL